ncbi:MAG: rRNA maturation RNase YbeY [Bacteroidales bacterium]|nr:rRNA maturation RNase YbeY [Bacteroidales bacterium]
MAIRIENREIIEEDIGTGKIRSIIEVLLKEERKRLGTIEIVLLKDHQLLEINRNYLGHNYYTDVITFSYNRKDIVKGDVLISVDSVKRNAIKFKQNLADELVRVIIHGVLHIIGYTDENRENREKMRIREDEYLKKYKEERNG